MLFNSYHFLIFFPTVLILYYLIPQKFRWALLLVASYYFYMSWNFWYLGLILTSTLIDYTAALKINNTSDHGLKKRWLLLSIFSNLGILVTFKYFNFFADSARQLLLNFGIEASPVFLNVILPVGISFYTFQTISYTVDVYRGRLQAETHLGYFALFVSFFPQLVAGPIERASHLLPQFKQKKQIAINDIHIGVNRILYGLFKKVVIADRLSFYVDAVYSDIGSASSSMILLASFFFLVQVYCDFSGYSDIAVGVARLLGFDLIINFSRPFLSTSFNEYWQRWHISLSNWVKDYIYIPLGGSRISMFGSYANLIIAFIIMGLWHGASWTFVLWGIMHGTLQALERLVQNTVKLDIPRKLKSISGWFVVMLSFVLSMIFFRAESTSDAFEAFHRIFSTPIHLSLNEIKAGLASNDFYLSCIMIVLLAISYLLPQSFNFKYNYSFGLIMIAFILIFGINETIEFVYFQF